MNFRRIMVRLLRWNMDKDRELGRRSQLAGFLPTWVQTALNNTAESVLPNAPFPLSGAQHQFKTGLPAHAEPMGFDYFQHENNQRLLTAPHFHFRPPTECG